MLLKVTFHVAKSDVYVLDQGCWRVGWGGWLWVQMLLLTFAVFCCFNNFHAQGIVRVIKFQKKKATIA